MVNPTPHLFWVIAGLFGLLAVGTITRAVMLRGRFDAKALSHFDSVRSWWALAAVLTIALALGSSGVLAFIGIAGILSLREFLQIIEWQRVGRASVGMIFVIAILFYMSLIGGFAEQTMAVAPIAIVVSIGALRAWLGLVEDFIRVTAALIWGALLFVYGLSHAYLLLELPGLPEPWAGHLGWFLYLVLLTEINDIGQALVGRKFGITKIVPATSPNKSLEGLVGGMVITVVVAISLAPLLTSFMQSSWRVGVFLAASAGILISTFGFLGDINKSGIKRDVGIKDSGALIPGQGGMMDRIDSLTFSAPVFYYFVKVFLSMNQQVNSG